MIYEYTVNTYEGRLFEVLSPWKMTTILSFWFWTQSWSFTNSPWRRSNSVTWLRCSAGTGSKIMEFASWLIRRTLPRIGVYAGICCRSHCPEAGSLGADPQPANPKTCATPPPPATTPPATTPPAPTPAAGFCGGCGHRIDRGGQGSYAYGRSDCRSHRADAPKQHDNDGRDGLGQ
jgi:hypothetical protein